MNHRHVRTTIPRINIGKHVIGAFDPQNEEVSVYVFSEKS